MLVYLSIADNIKKNYAPDENSYFPLIPGSYWKYQDSCYTNECEQIINEDLNMDARVIYIDSVISLENKYDGWHAMLIHFLYLNKKNRVRIKYYCKTDGSIFHGTFSKKFGLEMNVLREALTYPTTGDTIYRNDFKKEPFIYAYNDSLKLFYVIAEKVPDLKYPSNLYIYKKGVGLLEERSSNSAKVLLEYRIGNGPVIKLRKPR